MVTVHLHNLVMQAYHGVYQEEHKTGNNYEVNLDVTYKERDHKFERLQDTVNYEDLFTIVKKRMQAPEELLEKVCDGIIRKIKHEYPEVKEVSISIYKLQPPIENMQVKVGVSIRKTFDD